MKKDIITVVVQLNNYRFPKGRNPNPGESSIVLLNVKEITEGEIPEKAFSPYGDHAIIVKGVMPKLDKDVDYVLQAKQVVDPKWGIQYLCEGIRMDYDLDKKEDQIKFFSYFLTENQIESLYSMYDNPVPILKNSDIESLTKIKGIGPVTASRICMKYADNIANGRAYIVLKGLGLTKNAIDNLIKQFGSADMVIDTIETNPYSLIKLVRGYGWEKADKIALGKGFSRCCRERCVAYARYRLEKEADDGNSCMSIEELIAEVMEVCYPVERQDLVVYLKEDMIGQKDFEKLYQDILDGKKGLLFPSFFYSKDTQKVGLLYYRLIEKKIVTELSRLHDAKSDFVYDKDKCEQIIAEVEKEQGYEYTREQKQAIYNILDNNVSILTGSSGTGKSSTVTPLIRIFQYYEQEISQCALSGRAASLLTEYTGLTGKTIHRLLRYVPELERFDYCKNNQMPSDVVILDETSMVGEELFLKLIEAMKTGSKLIMLGDIKQLPPMNVGNLLGDCISSGYIKTNILTTIHRQALKSGIISQSLDVCQGKGLVKNDFSGTEVRGDLFDFKLVCNSDAMVVHAQAINEFKDLLSKGKNPDDIQVVVPVRTRGMNSCRMFNAEIQELVNPGNTGITIEVYDAGTKYPVTFKKKDKIMVIKNNYHAKTISGSEVAIFNGNLGHIIDIDEVSMIIDLEEQGRVIIPRNDWGSITHGWASTCHKCVTGDTLIYTNKGLKKIKELDNGAQVGEQRQLDSDILVFNGQYYEKPSHFYNAGVSETLKITTKYNYQLECTLDHKIKVQRNGQISMIPSSEIKQGDFVFVPINFKTPEQLNLPLSWQNRELDVRSKLYSRPTQMSEDLALFLGMMAADGTLRRRGFHYYKEDIETVKIFQYLLKKIFGYEAEIRKHGKNTNAWGVECSSTDISQFLLNIDGTQVHDKHVPSCIFTSSSECQCKFLQGFFEDGSVHMKKGKFDLIELVCKTKTCAEEIRMLLLQQGICCSEHHYYKERISKKTGKKLDSYKIMIYSSFAKTFKEKINFLNKEKRDRLEFILLHPEYSHSKENFISGKEETILLPVINIEKNINQTYCLTMPETHLFVQNGIIGSNCQGSGFPYTIVCLDTSAYVLLTREWLYTAITRAKKYCVLAGQPKAINAACRTSNIKIKQTWLRGDLHQLYLEQFE